MSGGYVGWALHPEDREALLGAFPPAYEKVVADHVTLSLASLFKGALPTARSGEVVGVADDGAGVQALAVRIEGSTDRPDGSTYHLTWSLGPGRRAVESNDVLRERGWAPIPQPWPIRLEPRRWP
jgi:hypothetical protein